VVFLCYRGFGYAKLNIGNSSVAKCLAMPILLKILAIYLIIAYIIAYDAEI
jgi:hypothetical protein